MTHYTRPTTYVHHTTRVWNELHFRYDEICGILPDSVSPEWWLSTFHKPPLSYVISVRDHSTSNTVVHVPSR